ncbi:STAS domain-containing protein [Streptomyces litmocidini]|uniref:STAS domain-containing protein n=1 Tax=Streptomyces litmocidini TaxID=67318 RepID=A0ABW7U6C4_9ACTN
MTALPDHTFELAIVTDGDGALYAELAGDLAWDVADELLDAVRARLSSAPGLSDVHLDCARMTLCDSMGLSAFLALHRDTEAAGARLHIDRRPPFLDRLLLLTGTYRHLTGIPGTAESDGVAPGEETDSPQLPGP